MNDLTAIRRLHEHRQWATHHLLKAAAPLSDEQLQRPLAIGQGTLWRTLCHMYAAEYVWLEALLGNADPLTPGDLPGQLPGNQAGEGRAETLDELIERWSTLDTRWNAYLDDLTAEMLKQAIVKKSTSSYAQQTVGTSALDIVLHVCTHAHYTLAQAMNMLRKLGVEPLPHSMLITLARQQAVERESSGGFQQT